MKTLGLLLAAVMIVGLIAAGTAWRTLDASRPARSGTRAVAGLGAPVEIRFDARARPYVRAETLGDAFFAQGMLHVQERLWQMELLSRAGRGRLAELVGPPMLDTDRELWRMGVPQLAARIEADATPETRVLVGRYVDGVNAALANTALPPELRLLRATPRIWTPSDVYALGAAMAYSSGRNLEHELLRLALSQHLEPDAFAAFLPDEARIPDFPYVVPATSLLGALQRRDALDAFEQALLPSASLGSNGWAVAPARTRNGHALFAFDSHDALALPNLHYEVHLFFGERAIRGWSVPGLPGVINGYNDRVAWGFTNIGDSQDLFLETRHPDEPERFLGPDGWYDATAEEVSIPVAGRAPERLRILTTRHGPLVEEEPPLSLAWTGHHAGRSLRFGLDALFDLNLARDWVETNAALDRLAAPSANATWADVDGHVAFRTMGLLPVRGRGEGLLPLPAEEAGVGWRGFLPMSLLPRVVDPPSGFVAAANARVNPQGVGPLISADNAPGYRIGRIQSVLAGSRDHTPDDMRALQMDWHNGQAERLLPTLLARLDPGSLDAREREAYDVLSAWQADPVNAPDAAAPWIFLRWYLALADGLFAERLGPELYERLLRKNYMLNPAVDGLILDARGDSPWWRGGRVGLEREAFGRAVAGLDGPPAAVRWRDHHRVHFVHELGAAVPLLGRWLDRGPYPWGGDHASVGRARYRYDRPERVRSGATVRVVIEMTEPMRARAIIPGGQAGHPSDPHYDDQIQPWLDGELDPLADRFEDVTGETLRLEPVGP